MNGHHRPQPAAFLLLPLAFAIILALFAWSNAEAGPRDLPVGVAGQPAQTRPIERGLASRGEVFDVHRYADEAANAAAFSLLTAAAVAAVVAGLEAVLGKAGIALGAVTMVFVGNPFSGAGTGPHMLPEPAGLIGQLLPPGAGANLARSTGYFDGAAAGGHAAVLAAWALGGFALLAVAGLRARRSAVAA